MSLDKLICDKILSILFINWFMVCVRLSSYGRTWEFPKHLGSPSRAQVSPRVTLTLRWCLACNLPRISKTRRMLPMKELLTNRVLAVVGQPSVKPIQFMFII